MSVPDAASRAGALALALGIAAFVAGHGIAQDAPPVPVGVTEIVVREVRAGVTVPGTVESPQVSLVAAETAGRIRTVHGREGMAVRAGAPLVSLDTARIELRLRAARAELDEARARLDLAERNLVRARELFADDILPRSGLDDAESETTAWTGRVERLDAEIARTELDLDRAVIRAPFGGVVVEERVESGEWVDVGDPCVEIQSTGSFDVRAPLPERHFAAVERGGRATVTFEALPGASFSGTVVATVPRAASGTRTFPVKVRVEDPDGRLAAGMLARVELEVGEPRTATLVPKDALVTDGRGSAVWVVGADDVASLATVRTGDGHGAWVEVLAGLSPGDRVVTRGNERLRPGLTVRATAQEYPLP